MPNPADRMVPASGKLYDSDGNVQWTADILSGTQTSVAPDNPANRMVPDSGKLYGPDGSVLWMVDLLGAAGNIDDGSITEDKLAAPLDSKINGKVDESSVGQPGGPAGPLDANSKIPVSLLPPLKHDVGQAATQADMLALAVEAPAMCIRTDFSPAHVFMLSGDPATDISNWHDTGPFSAAAADPSVKIGLTPINGTAATYMRSDAAPAIDQGIAPEWTDKHIFTKSSGDTDPSVAVASDNPQFELRNSGSDADEKRWNFVVNSDQLDLRALTDAGDVADTAWLLTRSGGTVTAHSFHAGGDALLELSAQSDITAFVDLHMSEQKIVNMGDPANAKDGVNLQTLNGRLSAAQRTAIDELTTIADPSTADAPTVANKLNDIINALQA